MLDKLEAIKAKFDDLGVALTNPEIVSNNQKFTQISKEYRSLEKIVLAFEAYKKLLDNIAFNREALMGDDEELRELAKEETACTGRTENRDGKADQEPADPQRSPG